MWRVFYYRYTMNMILRAKVKILLRHLPTTCQYLIKEMIADSDATEAKLRKRLQEVEHDYWYWHDRYVDEFLKGKNL